MASNSGRRVPVSRKAYDKKSKALERSEGGSESHHPIDTVPIREVARREEGLEDQQRVYCELSHSGKHSEPAKVLQSREAGLLQIKPTTFNQAVVRSEKRRSDVSKVERRKRNTNDRRRGPTHNISTTSRENASERDPSGSVSYKTSVEVKGSKAKGKGTSGIDPEVEALLAEVKHYERRLGTVLSRLPEDPVSYKQASQIWLVEAVIDLLPFSLILPLTSIVPLLSSSLSPQLYLSPSHPHLSLTPTVPLLSSPTSHTLSCPPTPPHLSAKLQTASMQLILSDLEMSCKQDLVDRLWRVAHYPTTENLRKQLQHSPDAGACIIFTPISSSIRKFIGQHCYTRAVLLTRVGHAFIHFVSCCLATNTLAFVTPPILPSEL